MRAVRYVCLAFFALLWAGGLSTTVSHGLYQIGLVNDDYRNGDLYRLAALPQFKTPYTPCPASPAYPDTARTDLYLIGDSFSEAQRISKADFAVHHYQRIQWGFPKRIKLNPNHRNILLIESVERHVQDHFTQPIRDIEIVTDTSQYKPQSWYRRIWNDFHREDVEERLATVLFGQDWAFGFKELKAQLTQNWFGRVNTGVSLSRNNRHIFIHSDTDTTVRQSSFSALPDSTVTAVVDSINAVADRYRQQGFDAVYLSIIPNKATILEPNRGTYNRLIERIQQHPALRVPAIDTYSRYRREPQHVYLPGDTHWSCRGRDIWLNGVRQTLGL